MSQARHSCFTKLYLKHTEFAYVSAYIKLSFSAANLQIKIKTYR